VSNKNVATDTDAIADAEMLEEWLDDAIETAKKIGALTAARDVAKALAIHFEIESEIDWQKGVLLGHRYNIIEAYRTANGSGK
jgi:hypothetical protein